MTAPTITFHGSAGTVTGSCTEIRRNDKNIIVDCGMFQGTRTLEALNYERLPFDPHKVSAVILTHAHLDHSGRLPYLVKSGCAAPIWCTPPTADIIEPLLLDSAKLQIADVERRNRRSDRAGHSAFDALYTADDVAACMGYVRESSYCDWNDLGDGCGFRFWDARHIETTLKRGGNLLIPAFAVERTQVVLEDLIALFDTKRLQNVDVFVDSPLAERVTRATLRYRDSGADMLHRPNIHFTHDVAESKKLNSITGAIIIAGSGMCTGGRIRHHLVRNLPNPASRVLLVGYQAGGTLGAVLKEGARHVRISGNDVAVKADIHSMDFYSTHADRSALLDWIKSRMPVLANIFLVHGEAPALSALASDVAKSIDLPAAIIPALGETWQLSKDKPATRTGKARPDAKKCTAPRDWTGQLAALQAGLGERLATLPSDTSRARVLAALAKALEHEAIR